MNKWICIIVMSCLVISSCNLAWVTPEELLEKIDEDVKEGSK